MNNSSIAVSFKLLCVFFWLREDEQNFISSQEMVIF